MFGFEKLASYIETEEPDLVIDAGNITQDGAAFFENEGTYIKEVVNLDGGSE